MDAEEIAGAFLAFCAAVVLLAAVALLTAGVVMIGWNTAMPHLFGLPRATYAAALGLTILRMALFATPPRTEKTTWTR